MICTKRFTPETALFPAGLCLSASHLRYISNSTSAQTHIHFLPFFQTAIIIQEKPNNPELKASNQATPTISTYSIELIKDFAEDEFVFVVGLAILYHSWEWGKDW